MRQTTSVLAEGPRGRWRFGCLKDVFPAHTGSEVSCGVGGVVQWPCLMCVRLWTCGCCVLIVGWVAVFRWPGDT